MGVAATLESGSSGQFDVTLDGETVATRAGGILSKVLGGGWPDEEAVVEVIGARLETS